VLTFNLVREPWIRCADLDGQVRVVGLAEAMASPHELSGVADESPLVTAALHRLLLAILHRNLGPRDTETWGDLWKQCCFPSEVLEAYWTKWESRFDLFDDTHPFYQSASYRA
jgi:CRISPR system Cascade subunit CasA